MSEITPIVLEQDAVSDDAYLVVELKMDNGTKVKKDDIVAVLETSKATFEVSSPADGFVYFGFKVDEHVPMGSIFGVISQKQEFPKEYIEQNIRKKVDGETAKISSADDESLESVRFSKGALKLIEEHRLEKKHFAHLSMVRKTDVENYLSSADTTEKPEKSVIGITEDAQKIVILGGGGHAKMCIDILKQMRQFEIAGLVDDVLEKGTDILGVPVIGKDDDHTLRSLRESGILYGVNGVGAVTNHRSREVLYKKLKSAGFFIPNIIHPQAVVEPSVRMGDGNQIMANATVGSSVKLGNNNIINSASVVSHDSVIGNNVHITPGAILAGSVSVGDNTIIGMGATVYLGATIGRNVVINNGVDVVNNIESGKVIK